jgi:glucose/arabinose dehydrogenase
MRLSRLPWRRAAAAVALAGILVTGGPVAPTARAATGPVTAPIKLALRASGLSKPVFVAAPNDGSHRLFIVEQTGRIRILANGGVLPTPFFDISGAVSSSGEQGLLGLAFHPSFATNRKFYVNYTNLAGDSVVSEYQASATDANVADRSTGRYLFKVDQPYANHNGGMLAFGPDGYLYIGFGDGGGAGDPGNRAQNLSSLLGKVLRIDINGTSGTLNYRIPPTNPYATTTGRDEIWQRGLRNPWRFSFDRANGNLWIADVGQSKWEEVDRAVRTSTGAGRGLNWGWRVMEGNSCYNPPTGCSTTGKTLPLSVYGHANGRCAVTGGYVYRGSAIPALVGAYVFGDYCSGEVFALDAAAPRPATAYRKILTGLLLSSFGEDWAGELYVCDLGGRVYQIVAA